MMMGHALAAVLAFIVGVLVCASEEMDIRRDYVKAGYIVIDAKPYRIIPAERGG